MNSPISIQKSLYRTKGLQARRQLSEKKRTYKSKRIINSIVDLLDIKESLWVAVYCSLMDEVQTDELIQVLFQEHKRIAVPKQVQNTVKLCELTSLQETTVSRFGIREPNTNIFVDQSLIDVYIVPGVAFDRFGTRIGWGKGYYDQLLQYVTVPKIGVSFSEQLYDKLPKELHDIVMNIVITDEDIIYTNTYYEKK